MILSSVTPGARQADVELETDEGKGEGESSRLLGSSSTKFDALPLIWSPPGQRGNYKCSLKTQWIDQACQET